MENKELKKQIMYKKTNAWKDIDGVMAFSEDYKVFLDTSKTEREAAKEAVRLAEEKGFVNGWEKIRKGEKLLLGDKVYFLQQNKSVVLFVMGKTDIEKGMNVTACHIDSPRLDLKATPVTEDGSVALMKTHYYGGIKKYQWTCIPLAMHGVIFTRDGEKIELSIGEKEDDPVFYISDLLVHLASDQMSKKATEVITGEQLNIYVGTIPVEDDEISEQVKFNVLKILFEKYGIIEEDFLSAEIEIVPAGKARDVGFDRSLIVGYGHDDRVCSYGALRAILETENPKRSSVCILADKEEIGSVGSTGMQSRFFENIISEIYAMTHDTYSELGLKRTLANSYVLSMDVSCALDPNFSEAFDRTNTAILGKGPVLKKYTGARGKSGCNDAHSEYLIKLRQLFHNNDVAFQTGELGKVDQGGGGTVAYMLANYGAFTVDYGVAVISMHAPQELISKADLYEIYRGAKAFYDFFE